MPPCADRKCFYIMILIDFIIWECPFFPPPEPRQVYFEIYCLHLKLMPSFDSLSNILMLLTGVLY